MANSYLLAARQSQRGLRTWRIALACVALFASDVARAHSDPESPVPNIPALKTDEPLEVDGFLNEPFWARCKVSSGFVCTRTHEPAADQTRFRVAYTKEYLYVGVECLESEPEKIIAVEQREDRSFQGDDWIEVHFDPPHNHRGKYAFFTNPLGTRADANEGPSGQFNYGWSAEWDCASQIQADRWTFEMRIPFKVLNFFREDGQAWGFNMTRHQRHTDVLSFWSYNDTDYYKPRHFGHLTEMNLEEVEFDRNWQFTPYVSGLTHLDGNVDLDPSIGIDISTRLTPAITAALALNPDFGQIEADDETIELRDTERFLPEKRLFFREGDELIRMPHRLYYSRRFTDIDSGLKASGMGRGFSFIFQNLQSEVAHGGSVYGNSSLLRVTQDIQERSYIGYYAAGSAFEEGNHSGVGGLDGYFFLTDAWRVAFQGAVAEERLSPDGGAFKDSTDYLGHASLIYSQYPWTIELAGDAITDEFDPVLGFIPRRDIYGPRLEAEWEIKGDGWYKEIDLDYETAFYVDETGDESLHDHAVDGDVTLWNDLKLGAGHSRDYHRPFYNYRTKADVDLWSSDYYKAINIGWAGGSFERVDYDEAGVGKRFKFWERLPISEEFFVRFEEHPDGEREIVWLNRVVFDLFILPNMWFKGAVQVGDHGLHNYSIVYGWEYQPQSWLYLAYNDVKDGLTATGRSLFVKLTYTF